MRVKVLKRAINKRVHLAKNLIKGSEEKPVVIGGEENDTSAGQEKCEQISTLINSRPKRKITKTDFLRF